MARLQTDAIIISSCLGVVWVGLIGTYKMIVNSVSTAPVSSFVSGSTFFSSKSGYLRFR